MIKKLIQPYLDILSHDLKTFVRNLHKKKSIRLEQALKELEFNRKKIDKLEDDFEKFGSFISEFSRLTDYKVVEPHGVPHFMKRKTEVDNLTRKFWNK